MTTAELVERLRKATPVDHDNCPELSHIAADWIEAAEKELWCLTTLGKEATAADAEDSWPKLAMVRKRLEAMK